MGVFDAVSSGSVEMGHSAAYYWKGKVPAAQFFTAVPFGMNAQEMNGWLFYGGGMELWRELYEPFNLIPFNLIPFAAGNTGVQMAGWFNKEINSVADLRGLRMRIPGLAGTGPGPGIDRQQRCLPIAPGRSQAHCRPGRPRGESGHAG